MQASDLRLGIVRLSLPDGRSIPLQLTYAALDTKGHDWLLDQFKAIQKGRSGSSTAVAELLEVLSDGVLKSQDILSAPAAVYPVSSTLKALWSAWELGQYGPDGRPAEDGAANPPLSRQPTLWARLWRRR